MADRPHEIALRHDARDLVVVSHNDDAANAMLQGFLSGHSNLGIALDLLLAISVRLSALIVARKRAGNTRRRKEGSRCRC